MVVTCSSQTDAPLTCYVGGLCLELSGALRGINYVLQVCYGTKGGFSTLREPLMQSGVTGVVVMSGNGMVMSFNCQCVYGVIITCHSCLALV